MNLEIENMEESDLDFAYWLFDQAIVYQEENNYPVWRGYDKGIFKTDIENHRQYKIVCDGEIAGIFSVLYSDKLIWTNKETGNAIYLHRIAVHPNFKGNKLFGRILDWAIRHAKANNRTLVRMDTWANNPNMRAYYQTFGFKFLGETTTGNDPTLPLQNRNLTLALLEMKV